MKTIDNSQLHLPADLLEALEEGETLVLTMKDAPLAMIVPTGSPATSRPFGLAKGEFVVPDDFNDPLPELEAEIYQSCRVAEEPPAP
jgi:antitoxin (DNA-binding transcriptional repressor) of toxin-antitoxin stability system